MPSPADADRDTPPSVAPRARVGLAIVVAATVIAILFGREPALALDSLGRLFVVGALSTLAALRRRWAAIALGIVVCTACVGLAVGAAQAGPLSTWGVLFGLDALLFAVGYLWFLVAGGARAARPAAAPRD